MIAFPAIFVTALISCVTADAPLPAPAPQPAYGAAAEPVGPAVYAYNYAVADDYTGFYLFYLLICFINFFL